MADKYPKSAQNPPFQPGARPDEQPEPRKRSGDEGGIPPQRSAPIPPEEREPGSYPKDEVMAHTLDPYREKQDDD